MPIDSLKSVDVETVNGDYPCAEAITPHNTDDLINYSRAVYVGGAGDVTAVMLNGAVVLFKAVPVGTVLPIRVGRINSTGTTATSLVSLY